VPEYGVQKFLYVIGAVVALLIVVGVLLPRHSRVEVSTLVDAPPATVFALVNDFRRVDLWSPRTRPSLGTVSSSAAVRRRSRKADLTNTLPPR
jgi:hypothetical protein